MRFYENLKSVVGAGFLGCYFLRKFLKTIKTIKMNNKCIRPLFLRKRGYAEKPTKEPTKSSALIETITLSHTVKSFVGEDPE